MAIILSGTSLLLSWRRILKLSRLIRVGELTIVALPALVGLALATQAWRRAGGACTGDLQNGAEVTFGKYGERRLANFLNPKPDSLAEWRS